MNTAFSHEDSPLSRMLQDDDLTIMERLIPYCPSPLAKTLALHMKFLEIRKILSGFDDEPTLQACGFEDSSTDMEAVLRSLRDSVSEEKGRQIDNMLNMLHFAKMYQNWQETMKTHPELIQLLNQLLNQATGNASGNGKGSDSSNAFADPSLYLLLNAAMNGDGNGNKDMTDILSALMNNARKS